MVFNTQQKQELSSKLQQLLTGVRLDGNVIRFGNRTFTLPRTSPNTVISSSKFTSR